VRSVGTTPLAHLPTLGSETSCRRPKDTPQGSCTTYANRGGVEHRRLPLLSPSASCHGGDHSRLPSLQSIHNASRHCLSEALTGRPHLSPPIAAATFRYATTPIERRSICAILRPGSRTPTAASASTSLPSFPFLFFSFPYHLRSDKPPHDRVTAPLGATSRVQHSARSVSNRTSLARTSARLPLRSYVERGKSSFLGASPSCTPSVTFPALHPPKRSGTGCRLRLSPQLWLRQ